jgi:hypothetical protein
VKFGLDIRTRELYHLTPYLNFWQHAAGILTKNMNCRLEAKLNRTNPARNASKKLALIRETPLECKVCIRCNY